MKWVYYRFIDHMIGVDMIDHMTFKVKNNPINYIILSFWDFFPLKKNKIYIRPILKRTPYELWKGRKPNISYFYPFRCKCFILNTKDNLGKFDSKSDCGIFIGYSKTSKAFRVYNSGTLVIEEAIHIRFGKNKPNKELLELDESFADLRLDDNITISSSSR